MINAISAADIAFIMSSSTSAWWLSSLECSPQKQNGWTLRFCFWGWIVWKMYNKTIIEFGFRMRSWIIKTSCLCYLSQPSASADNTDLGFNNSWYHAQPHPIFVYCIQDHTTYLLKAPAEIRGPGYMWRALEKTPEVKDNVRVMRMCTDRQVRYGVIYVAVNFWFQLIV